MRKTLVTMKGKINKIKIVIIERRLLSKFVNQEVKDQARLKQQAGLETLGT